MSDEITDEELRHLIDAARASRQTPASGDPDRAPMGYDFRRPQRVNKDQSRRLESIHEQFSRLFAATLSGNMRMVIDVDLAFCEQLVYNEFILSLPSPCTAYSFVMEPHGGSAILAFANDVIMAIIDRAFGGQGRAFAGDARSLTQIEMNVVNKLVARIFADLETTWEPITSVTIADVALETNPEFIQIAAPGDGVLVVAFEANTRSASGLVHLCYPLTTLDPILPRLEPGRPGRKGRRDPEALESQRRALARMQIPVEVQIARGVLPLSEVAQLKVGDVVKLDSQKGDPAVVFLGGRPKYLGRPGLRGRKRAVEIETEIAPEEEDHYT
ncbi:MAG: flagellar motor switch protein FliM [Gemmatimonadota bacterium]